MRLGSRGGQRVREEWKRGRRRRGEGEEREEGGRSWGDICMSITSEGNKFSL